MCGTGKGNNPFGGFRNWQEWHQKWAADPLGLGLTDYSGNLVSQIAGEKTLKERELEDEQKKQEQRELALRPNPQAIAPEPTAMLINPAAELRNRRRKAIMAARSNLIPYGPGANIPNG